MNGAPRRDEKGILIEVTGSEALAGATDDVYRPLSQPEARGRAILSGLSVVLLLGPALVGLALAAVKLYGSGHGGRDRFKPMKFLDRGDTKCP
jgi:hypothetical protein